MSSIHELLSEVSAASLNKTATNKSPRASKQTREAHQLASHQRRHRNEPSNKAIIDSDTTIKVGSLRVKRQDQNKSPESRSNLSGTSIHRERAHQPSNGGIKQQMNPSSSKNTIEITIESDGLLRARSKEKTSKNLTTEHKYGVTKGRDCRQEAKNKPARGERSRSMERAERCSKSEGAHMGLKRRGRINNFRGCRDKEDLLVKHLQENKSMRVINCFI